MRYTGVLAKWSGWLRQADEIGTGIYHLLTKDKTSKYILLALSPAFNVRPRAGLFSAAFQSSSQGF